jgi:hypothetical protein
MKVEFDIPIPDFTLPFLKKGVIFLILFGVVWCLAFGVMGAESLFGDPKNDNNPYTSNLTRSTRSFIGVLVVFADIVICLLIVALLRKLFTA